MVKRDRARAHRGVLAVAVVAVLAAVMALVGSAAPAGAAVSFTTQGSINQVYTWGHPTGTSLELLDAGGSVVATGTADAQGAKDFRDLPAGPGYQVRAGGSATSDPVTVTDVDSHPDDAFYAGRSTLTEGYGYITARDGTKLAANVTFPKDGSAGPWPVLVDYSGYDPAQPGTTPQEAQLYPHLGYVVVGVNMRGTTCSGGPFWFFEGAQRTDGYDVIETLAHQSWSNGDVGMVGISYSGYSQLYVGSTHPPHLRAITPLSPFSDGYGGILYPGGILNDGFALNWALDRQEAAKPSAHQWVKNRIAAGDTTCAQNQVMRTQSQDLRSEIIDGRFNEPKYAYLDPKTFVPDIEVPTYLATQWQDEQTGGYGAEVASMIAPNAYLRADFTNGTHVDAIGPEYFMQVAEFVDLFVGKRAPHLEGNGFYQQAVSDGLKSIFGTDVPIVYNLPQGTYQQVLDWYLAQDPIRIHWEMGGVAGKEGKPYSTVRTSYPSWPLPNTSVERWYLQPDGALAKTAPTVADDAARGASTYTYDPSVKRNSTFTGSTEAMWLSHPNVHWDSEVEGKSLSFVTPAATTKTAYAGTGSADLWLRSSAVDTDLEVTLTEERPDGKEVYIQSGWLRASRRALDGATSTPLRPRHTFQEGDAAPLPAGEFVPVRIEIFPFAHIVRPGSRLRLNIEAPGGNQPFWAFSTLPGTATNDIAHSVGMPSSVALPKLADGRVTFYAPNAAPSCSVAGVTTQAQSLRNQPCRDLNPARVPTAVAGTAKGNKVALGWTAPPTWPSGPALTGYRVTVAPTGDTFDVGPGATTATYDAGTATGPFTFRVAALYGTTVAPASDASLPVAVVPPSAVSARPGDGTALVSWKAPVNPGASVTGYRVTPYRDGTAEPAQTFASTGLNQTLTGLTNGAPYRFAVSAVYGAAGAGAPSAKSDPIVVGAPGLPGFQRATPGSQKAVVAWTPPAANGSPVTGYVITPYVGDTTPTALSPITFNSTATSQTITGLTNGQTYRFAVSAVNARGTGPAATTSPVVVNPTVAGAPIGVNATSGNANAVVKWVKPSSDGGSAITGYVITPSLDGTPQAPQTFASTATTQTVTGLTNGGSYTFAVAAVNGAGTGPAAATSPPLIVGTPGRPGFVSASGANHQATIAWWAPSGNGGPITGYVITPYIGTTAQTPIATNASNKQVITGLTNGVAYTFKVVAVNLYGQGPAGGSNAVTPNPTQAGAPTSVVVKAGNGSAALTWKAPSSDGGSPITGYLVYYRIGTAPEQAVAFGPTATSGTVPGLTNGSAYWFTMYTQNAVGLSLGSAPMAAPLVVGAPGSPAFLKATAGAGQVTLNWWVPADNGSPITGYVVTPYVGGVAQAPRSFAGNTNKVIVTGLAPGTAYTFDVAAVNARGTGVLARSPAATPT